EVEGIVDARPGWDSSHASTVLRDVRRALLCCDLGHEAEARALFETLSADDFAAQSRWPWGPVPVWLVEICASLGDRDHAAVLYDMFLPYAGRVLVFEVAVLCYGAAAHYLGMLAATMERWDVAEAHFEDALAMHARMGARPLLAHTRREYAAMLLKRRAPGDAGRARGLIAAATATYDELGMDVWAAKARGLLEGAQVGAGRAAAYPAGLTEREVEVLRLLAAGRTNPEIAERLVLSAGTVARHTANIYAKIGARGRAEAGAFAVRSGLMEL
ncbi:MAG: helix-turn-helix domain-containing protein, partial [Dehalococcoidia bacterium]